MSWISKHKGSIINSVTPQSGFGLIHANDPGSGAGATTQPGGSGNVMWEPGWQNFFSGAYGNNAEANYSAYINSLTPEQLLKRYQNANQGDVGTQGGILGTQDANNFQAYSTFKSLFGRVPTQGELSQIIPAFQGPNGHINGQAFLANLQQQYQSNPNLDPNKAIKTEDAQGSVSQQFKSILGRDATADELSHFTQAIQSGQVDAYGLGSFLKQMPEYTNAQDKSFRGSLNEELTGYDTQAFNRQRKDVEADYARRGINAGSSPSLDYALTDLMGKIAENRGSYLASLSSAQYGGNKDLAIGNYKNSLDQMYTQNQQRTQGQTAYGNALMDRGFQGADYQTQMNDFMSYLNQNKGRRGANPLYGAAGGLVGGGIGAFFGGAPGAQAGYQMGSGAGNGFGYLNS